MIKLIKLWWNNLIKWFVKRFIREEHMPAVFPYIDSSGEWKVVGINEDQTTFDTVHKDLSETVARSIASQANFEGHFPTIYKAVHQ